MLSVGVNRAMGFKCHHNRCVDMGWKQFKEHYGIETTKKKIDLIDIGRGGELWHTPDGQPYATTPEGVSFRIPSKGVSAWLRKEYYRLTEKGVGDTALETATNTLAAIACHDGPEHNAHCRLMRKDGRMVLDLSRADKQVVVIEKDGWSVEPCPADVKFFHRPNAAPLPIPKHGGTIDLLRPYVNCSSEKFPLFVGALLDGLKGNGPYFVIQATGEQGSAKSTMLRVARRFIDNVQRGELTSVGDDVDLFIAAQSNGGIYLDNLSRIKPTLSDTLCKLATGGGISKRQLYTDDEELILDACCPVWLNGIEEIVQSSDLASRTVSIPLERVQRRIDECLFWKNFDNDYPKILGCLLDALSAGLQRNSEVEIDDLPRMADSAKWIAACFPALGLSYEDFRRPYEESQAEMAETALGNSLPATALIGWFEDVAKTEEWQGPAKELHGYLYDNLEYDNKRYFPKPKNLMGDLTRLAPDLRRLAGLDFGRLNHPDGKAKKHQVGGVSTTIYYVRKMPAQQSAQQSAQSAQSAQRENRGERTQNATFSSEIVPHSAHSAQPAQRFSLFERQEKKRETMYAIDKNEHTPRIGVFRERTERTEQTTDKNTLKTREKQPAHESAHPAHPAPEPPRNPQPLELSDLDRFIVKHRDDYNALLQRTKERRFANSTLTGKWRKQAEDNAHHDILQEARCEMEKRMRTG